MAVDDKDRSLIAAAHEGQFELIVSLVENHGVPVDYQESMVSLTQPLLSSNYILNCTD